MKAKKIFTAAILCAALCSAMTGCGGSDKKDSPQKSGLNVVCTSFAAYDWTCEIVGDHSDEVEVTYLLESGVDLHSYQPSVADITKISDCDVFIYVGGESESWTEDLLKEARNKDMKTLRLLDIGTAVEEELKEGMEAESEEEPEDGHGEETEYDEHVWLSLRNAQVFCEEIADLLGEADSENAEDYKSNAQSYCGKLGALDTKFTELFSEHPGTVLIFGDRFPFRYFCADHGVDYYAAFAGCSAETEASFETVTFLAGKVDELDVGTVFTIENSDGRVAQSIVQTAEKSGVRIAQLDSVQSVSRQDMDNGRNYLSIMEKNYDTLKEALG
ncbi:MAG: zinc ABC transporter substrate-binding protein [Ruminococcus sp.]|nr:zinc ABC transporter substrate-binding protein [Ruminococcus sp.]